MNTIHGRRARPRVVCLHSSGGSSRQWLPLAERLGDAWRVLSPDLLGHATAPAWNGAARDILVADADRVAHTALSDGPAHLVGHSYGAAVAMTIALRYPDRVTSLVAYEPVLFNLLREFAPASREAREATGMAAAIRRDLVAGLASGAAHRFVDYWAGDGTYGAMPALHRESIARRMPAVSAHFTALWTHDAKLADYARIVQPVTLLVGAHTRIVTRRIAELLRFALRGAVFQPMTAMGHMGPISHPHTIAQRIAADLRAVERTFAGAKRALAA